ncbi:MAG: hypothetical protein AB7Q29_08290 [Vicinamibacterales bacterium]
MRHMYVVTAALLGLTLSGAACDREPVQTERDTAAEEAAREAERVAEEQRQRNEEINQMSERVSEIEREYEEKSANTPRGSAGTAAARVRGELSEDLNGVKQAVADLRTTTADNWWDRYEQAIRQSVDDLEADVKEVARIRTLPAPEGADTPQMEQSSGGAAPAPFASARDRFVAEMQPRIASMTRALDNIRARGARQTRVEQVRAQVEKLRDDLDALKASEAGDWWDLSKARVQNAIERLDESIEQLGGVRPS